METTNKNEELERRFQRPHKKVVGRFQHPYKKAVDSNPKITNPQFQYELI